MIIEKILKQLTPERVKKEVEAIQKIKLPPELQRWVKEYEKVGERGEFLWKWIYKAIKLITFPIVEKKYQRSIFKIKFLVLMMFAVLINDAADKLKNKKLLDGLLKIPFKQNLLKIKKLNQREREYIFFVEKLWKNILFIIKKYPHYSRLKDMFNFDVFQFLIANQYDYFISNNYQFSNKTESWLYPPYTMAGMICGTIDLMCSSKIKEQELRIIREIMWHAQKMARIGNWVSTWEREIYENDFTSGLFVYAIDSRIIKISNLKKENGLEIIKKIRKEKIVKKLLSEWEMSYDKIKELSKKIKLLNARIILLNLKKLLVLELSSQGFK